MKRTARILGILAGVMFASMGVFATGAHAQTQAVQDGMNYLYSVQNPDGSWGSASSAALKGTTTSAVLGTLTALEGETPSIAASTATNWFNAQILNTTAAMAERVLAVPSHADSLTLSTSSNVERKNIQFILGYEKKMGWSSLKI